MNKFLKWWYIVCIVAVAVAVLTMAACVCTHVRTHDDQLLAIANYARYAIFGALATAILPLPVIWVIRFIPPLYSIGAHLPQPPDETKNKK